MPTAFITCPRDQADDVANTIVKEELAACVNAVDCRSTYWWEDEVQMDEEVILLCKTTDAGFDALAERVDDIHPYEVPCIERFDEEWVASPFADWIAESVNSP